MKALTFAALFLGLIFTAQVSRAADLDSIWELDKQAKYYNDLSQELAEGVSRLEDLHGCEGTNFSAKFEKVFNQREIHFIKNRNMISGEKLHIAKCNTRVTERLMALIRTYQVEASAWSGLYKKALEAAAVSNKVAKRELIKLQNDQKEALAKLKIEANKAKPDSTTIRTILYGALFIVGIIALGAAALTGVGLFFYLLFNATAVAGSGLGIAAITLLAFAGVGGTAGYYGNQGLEKLAKDEMIYTNYMSDVQIRASSLEQSQKFINAMKDDADEKIIQLKYY